MFIVEYEGFLQKIRREFKTKEDAILWLWKVGKKELIHNIKYEKQGA